MHRQRWQQMARMVASWGNPLRRRVDRAESAIIVGLIAAFLVAAPLLAMFAGRAADAAGIREQRAARGWAEVPAILQQGAAAGAMNLTGDGNVSWVRARWTMPGGIPHTGLVAVALNARAGDRTMVWVTQAGQLTHPPLTRAQVHRSQVLAETLAPLGLAAVLLAVGGVIRLVANRRRIAGWTQAWETTGPRWSSRR
jgi:hypothetical protein